MPQFDVYENPGKKSREAYPYIIDVQNALISDITTRIVIPLGRLSYFRNEKMDGLTPTIRYKNEEFILLTPQIASIPASLLKTPIGSLEAMRDEIIAAIDFAITGI
ncbi:CcdB family protein [Thalassomonas sp. RHCl1]|uniref:CcdB family protein n=1 Tax=Thalassomonas sp. RHCl1 TaxID=2995320 RepID=UPI00248AAD0E|nr:CcdB family protein [Thalassomonas sp. RHCl1]